MIVPEKKTIKEILKTNKKFVIPRYQRKYDWGTNELQDFIEDVEQSKPESPIFLGTFIFDVSKPGLISIVDGQQRITTLYLLLIAIRHRALNLGNSNTAAGIKKYIDESEEWDDNKGLKISVSENIRMIFEYIADSEWNGIDFPNKIGRNSVKRQVNKIKPIYQHIETVLKEYSTEQLNVFIKSLLSTYVIKIDVNSTNDVFAIFERTNARGLDLNVGDLLKNYIFQHGIEDFEEQWNEIITNADSGLQRMLKYFMVSRKGYLQKSKLYRKLKKYAKSETASIDVFVNELLEFSEFYRMILDPTDNNVREWLKGFNLDDLSKTEYHYQRIGRVFNALKLFRVTQPYPLLFSIFKFYKNTNSRSYKNLFTVLETIESYHFVNNVISGKLSNEVEKLYAEKAAMFFSSDLNFIEETRKLSKRLSDLRANVDEFKSNFKENITYSDKQLVFYVYDRINNYGIQGGERTLLFRPNLKVSKANYNIEHFIPQINKKNLSKNEAELLDNIGNLFVISMHVNSKLHTMAPQDKIDFLLSDKQNTANLNYLDKFITDYSKKLPSWSEYSIEDRAADMAQDAYERIWNF